MGSEVGYKKKPKNDIKLDFNGNFEIFLVFILKCKRSDNNNPNQNECQILA